MQADQYNIQSLKEINNAIKQAKKQVSAAIFAKIRFIHNFLIFNKIEVKYMFHYNYGCDICCRGYISLLDYLLDSKGRVSLCNDCTTHYEDLEYITNRRWRLTYLYMKYLLGTDIAKCIITTDVVYII